MIALALLLLAATDKLPPAHALPPPVADEAAVLAPVNALFAAIAARDGAAMAATGTGVGTISVASEEADGSTSVTHRSWVDLAAGMKPGPERYEERLIGPAVEIDGNIAMVWGRYVFLIDGKPHHCGVDHFDLVREGGGWKILNATWSKRTTGCEAQ